MIDISEGSVRSGEITPRDMPGFPVRITEPGSYRLTSDLHVNADASFLEIEADDVTVDLGGHRVFSGWPGSNDGIRIRGHRNLAIFNGTICKFAGWGIHDPEGNYHEIAGVRLIDNGSGGALLTGSGHTIRNCVASENFGDGFLLGDGCLVLDSRAVLNRGHGIVCGVACIVDRCVALSNTGDGVILDRGSIARGVSSARNEIVGIRAEGSVIAECALSFCGDGTQAGGSVITHSLAHGNRRGSNPGGSRGNGRGFDVYRCVLEGSCADGNEYEGVTPTDSVVIGCNMTTHAAGSLAPRGENLIVENRIGSVFDFQAHGAHDIFNHIARNWIMNDQVAGSVTSGSYVPTTGDNANRTH